MANTNLWSCLNLYNTFNIKVMSAKAKFNHNITKAKRQNQNERDLLEQKFINTFNPFNTTNLKDDE